MTDTQSSNPDNLRLLESWMDQYGQDVMNVAYAYVKNYHQAEDIVQDVFLKAYLKRDTFRGDSSLKTWLLTITANRCKDHLRSAMIRRETHDEARLEQEPIANHTEAAALANVERSLLWNAILELPDKYREVIVLYYLQDFSGQEISAILQTSEQNIRTRLHRGRTMLKDILERREYRARG